MWLKDVCSVVGCGIAGVLRQLWGARVETTFCCRGYLNKNVKINQKKGGKGEKNPDCTR